MVSSPVVPMTSMTLFEFHGLPLSSTVAVMFPGPPMKKMYLSSPLLPSRVIELGVPVTKKVSTKSPPMIEVIAPGLVTVIVLLKSPMSSPSSPDLTSKPISIVESVMK